MQGGVIYHTDGLGHTISPISTVNPQKLLAQGGAPTSGYTWGVAVGSSLPPGTTVDSTTGVFHLNGTLVSGNYSFTLTVSDGSTSANGTFSFSVTDDYNSPATSTPCEQINESNFPLLNATLGVSYGASLYADGGTPPYSNWHFASGTLPPGMVIDSTYGVVRGTPTSNGTYSFGISFMDSTGAVANNPAGLTYTITVGP